MILNPHIFRAYDIRGIAFQDFDEDGFFVIAKSFVQFLKQKHQTQNLKIFVSGDARNSMAALFPSVISGLKTGGADVFWGGILPTPINFFALHEGGFDASIQITASHNPANYNGLKLTDKLGSICGEEIQEIRKISECLECAIGENTGSTFQNEKPINFSEKYLEKILEITPSQTSQKIVVDAGNAISGIYYPDFFEKFGHKVTRLFCDLDPSFPNHEPDPEIVENLSALVIKVQEESSNFGFAFDGDGDRLGIVRHTGEILSPDKIMYVLAADFLSRNPNEKIVVDIMTSSTLIDKIKKLGGQVILSPTGHSFIEENLKKHKAKLGGEQSGHFMFGENFYGHDDAFLAALRFLSAIQNIPSLISEITNKWPKTVQFYDRIETKEDLKFLAIEKFAEIIKKQYSAEKLNLIDGVRIDFGDGEWAIFRASNTASIIRAMIEANDKERLEKYKEEIMPILQEVL
jgi:phosphomannomutase/phosphoglucomutase